MDMTHFKPKDRDIRIIQFQDGLYQAQYFKSGILPIWDGSLTPKVQTVPEALDNCRQIKAWLKEFDSIVNNS